MLNFQGVPAEKVFLGRFWGPSIFSVSVFGCLGEGTIVVVTRSDQPKMGGTLPYGKPLKRSR